jgi:hypothetical protein
VKENAMLTKIRTLFNLKKEEKMLFTEAFIFLAWARLMKVIPFRRLAPMLGNHMNESTYEDIPSMAGILRYVSSALHIMSKYTFWESECLVKAIAGMKMLQRRGIESTLYLGIAKDEHGKMIAHAWLRSGSYYVSGAEEMKRFTVVCKFANK